MRATPGWQDAAVTDTPANDGTRDATPVARPSSPTSASPATASASPDAAPTVGSTPTGSTPVYSTPESTGPDAALSPDTATPLVDDPALTETAATADANRHTLVENVMGVVTGVFIASFGLFLLKASGAVSGGTAGIALLLDYAGPLSFGALFMLVNVPFFALAVWKKGIAFTLRTVLTVAMVSAMSYLHPAVFHIESVDPVYGTLGGNLLVGVGLLILFRHGASLGGINILALVLQEKLGWRAGYVQMAVDVVIILFSLTVVSPWIVLLSAAGAVVLNLVLALNHKQGRYLGRT
ncbi:putative 5xTM membrane YitT family protein [Frigoribacterium sp. PhB116]|nr:putative 5xTM membrane YitT family protein [Frigoribacterium sp. PhB107]TDT63931.1 putative 5xTM membrane YitT family protein [Frigoribacterium sp. PhB116]